MSQQRECPPQALDGFSRLPMEINIQIMMLLNPQQLLSLTAASPAVRRHFLGDHHESILKPQLQLIYKYYGHPASIPLIVLLSRLRALRARLKGRPKSEIEHELEPILTSVLSHDIMVMPSQWQSNLHIVTAAKFQVNIAFSSSDLRPWGWDQDCEKGTWEDWIYAFDAPDHYKGRSPTITTPGKDTPETTTESEIADFLGRTHREKELFGYHLSLKGNHLLTHLWSLKPHARSISIVKEFSNFLASHPFCDSIYPGNLEKMKSIHQTWRFKRDVSEEW
ncbi:hypothetical protein FPRO03_13370 [Fusarium proliferatum]|nr:hypothetical protein FPRO03_13370 [Fusarium proliferatum]